MSPQVVSGSAALLSPAAAELLRQVRDDPSQPMSVAVCGPGGYGKTALLHEVAASYRAAGVAVGTWWQPAGDAPGSVLLVDDAHLLSDEHLRDIARHAEQPGARVVVAYRPWPRPSALPTVTEVLRRRQPPVSLTPLAAPQVLALCAEMGNPAGSPAPTGLRAESPAALSGWADFLFAQTGGVPRYLDRLIAEPAGGPASGEGPPEVVPEAALAAFAADFEELDSQLLAVLLAVEAGAGLSPELVAALLDREPDQAAALVAAAKATGMLVGNGALVPLVRQALAVHGPVSQRIQIRRQLAGWQLARGGPVLELIRPLLEFMPETGLGDGAGRPTVGIAPGAEGSGLGEAFQAAGDEALRDDPALAARLFAAASGAGRPAAARRALATALAGDLDLASLLADQVLAAGPAEQRHEAACVAAAALAHRNHLARAVELYRWATPRLAAGFGAIGLVGTGRREEAEKLLAAAPDEPGDPSAGPPTLLSTAAYGMARGVCDSVDGSPVAALSALVQTAHLLEPSGSAVLLPDSPAALAGLVAVHCTEFGTAQAVLERAIETGLGGPLFVRRHRLILAWTLMVEGRLTAAAEQAALAGVHTAGAAQTTLPGGRPTAANQADRQLTIDGVVAMAGRASADPERAALSSARVSTAERAALANGRVTAAEQAAPGSARITAAEQAAQAGGRTYSAHQTASAGRYTPHAAAPTAMAGRQRVGTADQDALAGAQLNATHQAAPHGVRTPAAAPITPDAGANGYAAGSGAGELQGRDLIFAAALRIGLARRTSDMAGLRAAWPQAGQALIGQPVDLFTLLPLGEIAVAAARLGEQRQVEPALAAADELLQRLGDPPLWALPLHWARLHAAMVADDSPAGERHVTAMRKHSDQSSYAAALAAAGQCWLDVLSDRIEPEAVEAAAREMAEHGLSWDGARLAGQAAIRTQDRKAMTSLLDCARSLQARQSLDRGADAPAARGARTEGTDRPVLSDREQEVATLVLNGLTYKQVADRLYISAKTVEHHMARIRHRLGCTDRRELLARLRTLINAPAAPAAPRDPEGIQP
ncbi:MAG: LuxR C-terminal-related transcriptional regulator [Actinoplanes sp.]